MAEATRKFIEEYDPSRYKVDLLFGDEAPLLSDEEDIILVGQEDQEVYIKEEDMDSCHTSKHVFPSPSLEGDTADTRVRRKRRRVASEGFVYACSYVGCNKKYSKSSHLKVNEHSRLKRCGEISQIKMFNMNL